MRPLASSLVLFALGLVAEPARAQVPEPRAPEVSAEAAPGDPSLESAKQYFEAGKNAYGAKDYAGAIRAFKAAEALRPSPILDYNIGLANQQLGKTRVAVRYFQRYLAGMPDAPNRGEVEARIQALEGASASVPGSPAAPAEAAGARSPSPSPSSSGDPSAQQAPAPAPYPSSPPRSRARSLWWVPLVVVGGVALVAAVVLLAYYASPSTTVTVGAGRALSTPPSGGVVLFRF